MPSLYIDKYVAKLSSNPLPISSITCPPRLQHNPTQLGQATSAWLEMQSTENSPAYGEGVGKIAGGKQTGITRKLKCHYKSKALTVQFKVRTTAAFRENSFHSDVMFKVTVKRPNRDATWPERQTDTLAYLFSTISSVRWSSSLLLFSLLFIISRMVTARLRSLRNFSIFSYDTSSFFRFWKCKLVSQTTFTNSIHETFKQQTLAFLVCIFSVRRRKAT